MAASSKITADFTSDTSGMQKGIARIAGMFNKLTKTSSNTQKALSRMTSGINFLVFDRLAQYALAAGRAFKNMVSGSITAIDAVDKLSKSTGISTDGLQVFGLAAQKAGVDQIALAGAFGRMSKRLAEASQGFGEALPALERLGLSAQDLMKLSPEDQFLKIGEAIGGLATQGEQAAAAFKIFSDQGLRLVPLFADINAQTEAARAELEKFGGILSSQQIAGTVALKDNLTDVSQIFSNIVNQVTANLAPAISAAAEAFKEFISSAGGANIGKGISDGIFDALESAAGFVDQVIAGFAGVAEVFGVTGTLWENVAFTLDVAFKFAYKVGKLLEGVFYAFQTGVAGVITLLSGLLLKITWLVNKIPGIDLDNVEQGIQNFRKSISEEMDRTAKLQGEAFGEAFGNSLEGGAEVVKGGYKEFIQDLRSSSIKIQQPETQKIDLSEESKKALSGQNKISGLDARSSAGLNFLLQSGVAGKKPEEETAKNTKQIAKNTAQPGINVVQMGIA
jgi:hypothetical protein